MTYFLASRPFQYEDKILTPNNRFIERLQDVLPQQSRALFICSSPDQAEANDHYAQVTKECFEHSQFYFSDYVVLDRRTQNQAAELVAAADLLMLAGGYVPEQNQFFQELQLRQLLKNFSGVIVASSAGAMNSADIVYAQPELEGEALSKDYQHFLSGLDLTKTMILPHYQDLKDEVLDGLRLFEDITYADSYGRVFYALVDGTYLLVQDGKEWICGEAYRICDGKIQQITSENQLFPLS
ncbi:Type 1 glutamine amidotransferase-like domain-containing protein [Streptococcus pneumoniae]